MSKLSGAALQNIWDYQNLATLQSPVLGDVSLERLMTLVADVQGVDWILD